MERNYSSAYQEQDVYAGVVAPDSSYALPKQETQEFSLEGIQTKLGDTPSAVAPQTEEYTAPDLMPSNQTLNMSYERNYSGEKAASKISTKTKVLAISYVAVVLVLVLAVAICGVAVSESFSGVVALDGQYGQITSEIDALQKEISTEDYADLLNKAQQLGYVDASNSNTQSYTRLETRPAQNFNVETNWFDSLCDWLCSIFGE